MRWDDLFDDLTAQGRAADAADLAAEVDDRSRWEAGQVTLLDRLPNAPGHVVGLVLEDGSALAGPLLATGDGWLALQDVSGEVVVPVHSLARVVSGEVGTSRDAAPPARERAALRQLVRRLARDRAYVRVTLRAGRQLGGTVDRAGADHLELAEHDVDVARRHGEVRDVSLVPYAAVLRLVRTRPWS